jgi:hypothetical protein
VLYEEDSNRCVSVARFQLRIRRRKTGNGLLQQDEGHELLQDGLLQATDEMLCCGDEMQQLRNAVRSHPCCWSGHNNQACRSSTATTE